MKAVAADTVYINGNIYTMDTCMPKASCLAVKEDRIVYAGGKVQVDFFIGEHTKVIDLEGKSVYPGFNESHMHLQMYAEGLLQVDVFCRSKEEILEHVAQAARAAEPGEWIRGMGWSEQFWEEKVFPTKEELDAVSPDHPVYLERFGGHMGWANSKALELAGITEETEDPQGGEYLRGQDGKLTGCMNDTAADPIEKVIPPVNREKLKAAVLKAQEELLSFGVTSFGDLMTTDDFLNLMEELYQNNELKLRGYYALTGPSVTPVNEQLEHWYQSGPRIGAYGNRYTVRSVKLFADGSLGARSAALFEDYADRPGWRGKLLSTDEQFFEIVDMAAKHGFQVITHSIGDRANEQVLNIYKKVIEKNRLVDPRMRIEHFQVIRGDHPGRALEAGILPSMQATNATFNYPMPDARLGKERVAHAYAWRKVLDAGNIIAGGTDAPITTVNPLVEMHSAVTRKNDQCIPPEGWETENAVTRSEALLSQTLWAAYATFEEELKGSLTPGKLADFVVTERDIMVCPANEIKDIQVLMTVIGGETVYQAGEAVQ